MNQLNSLIFEGIVNEVSPKNDAVYISVTNFSRKKAFTFSAKLNLRFGERLNEIKTGRKIRIVGYISEGDFNGNYFGIVAEHFELSPHYRTKKGILWKIYQSLQETKL